MIIWFLLLKEWIYFTAYTCISSLNKVFKYNLNELVPLVIIRYG